jgi:CRISPR-associated protein Csm1
MREVNTALLNYALHGMKLPLLGGSSFDLTPYLDRLATGKARDSQVDAILTTLAPQGKRSGTEAKLTPGPLMLTRETIFPAGKPSGDPRAAFERDWRTLGDDPAFYFEAAAEVIRKHAWAVQGQCGEPGVSLYEEFKLLTALVYASGCAPQPAEQFLLIGGDFPGIQRAIYTITSKGAIRGLRGRSFFLQLLGDAVVRRLLGELGLPWQNVIYAAGGKFVILAQPGADQTALACVDAINERLLDDFHGDLSLCVACQPIGVGELYGRAFDERWKELKDALGEAKQRPLVGLAQRSWDKLFSPFGAGTDKHCAVCHYDPPDERELHRGGDGDWWCEGCLGFNELAETLCFRHGYLSVDGRRPEMGGQRWQERLYELSGLWYDLHDQPPTGSWFYCLNNTDFCSVGAVGFRFLAIRTPVERDMETGQRKRIVDFDTLARISNGIERIGILRMDVDSLGNIFGSYIQPPSLTHISAASAAMSLFFDGWLNVICEEVERKCRRPDSLYLVYAGGDDLFAVGPWDVMPELAQRIRSDLGHYVNHNPYITISAGIAVEDEHFPLYQAAEHARKALDDEAKEYSRDGRQKDAISFLGAVVGWEEWETVTSLRDELLGLLQDRMPSALVQTIRQMHAQYEQARERQKAKPGQLIYGRWMWMQAYTLTRLAEHHKEVRDVKMRVNGLQKSLLDPQTIRLAGLSARWVQYLIRKKAEKQGGR